MTLPIESKWALPSHPNFPGSSPPEAGDALAVGHQAAADAALLDDAQAQTNAETGTLAPAFTECDAKRNALIDNTGNVRAKRSANSTEAAMLRDAAKELGWVEMSKARISVHNATQALLAVMRHAGMDPIIADAILAKLGNKGVTLRQLSSEPLMGNTGALLDQAALLHYNLIHSTSSTKGAPRMPASAEIAQVRTSFAAVLEREALKHSMFNARDLSAAERATVVHFRGNALVNASGKKAVDLANDPTLLENPGFARLAQDKRVRLVAEWLDEHGLDTQYAFGTIENSMATVLKTAALKGGALGKPYASEKDLATRFMRAANSWSDKGGSLVDPRVLFGLHLARTQGIDIEGASLADKLTNLQQYIKDVFAEAATPPRFDRRQTALDILKEKTGLSEAQLTAGGDQSVVGIFLSKVNPGFFDHRWMSVDNGPSLEPHALMREAEEAFNNALPTSEWVVAHARMELRRAHQPISDEAVKTKAAEVAKDYAARVEPDTTSLLHWAESMPIIGIFTGLGEGIVEGDASKIVSAIPVVGNVYNIVGGAIAHDGERVTNAALTLIPVVGSVYNIEEGVRAGDVARATGGVVGLGIDIATLGAAHAVVSRYAGARTVAEAAEHFSAAEIPSPLSSQAAHTLGALEQLEISNMELAVTPTARRLAANYGVPKPAEITVATVGKTPVSVEGTFYINIGPDWFKVRKDTANNSWRIVRPDNSATAYRPPVDFVDGSWVEHGNVGLPGGGYFNLDIPPTNIDMAVRRATEYAEQHADTMTPAEELGKNARGQLQRTDYNVLFRGDMRSPIDLVESDGFNVSHSFANEQLTEFQPLIASAKYEGARTFITAEANGEGRYYYIYALKSEGREAASLNENAHFNAEGLAELVDGYPEHFENAEEGVDAYYAGAYEFDEIHVRGGFTKDEIYLLDTNDPEWTANLNEYYAGQPNVLGLPLSDIQLQPASA